MTDLHLISHPLCPYVQRVAIALAEKRMPFRRTDIDLAAKPEWFLRLSPLGKTPVLVASGVPVFESAVILEFLEETGPSPLHPRDPLERARHRGWIELASAALNDIAAIYGAPDAAAFGARADALATRFVRIERELGSGPWFAGGAFGLVDAAFAPVFRYFDVMDGLGLTGVTAGLPKVSAWRRALAARPSVLGAAPGDYPDRLLAFLRARDSHLGRTARAHAGEGAPAQ